MNNDDLNKLILFHKRVDELRHNAGFFKRMSLKSRYDFETGVERVTFEGPDKTAIQSMIVDFRVFILNDEPVNFFHIRNIIEKNVKDDKIISKERNAFESWKKVNADRDINVGGFNCRFERQEFSPSREQIIDWYLNGKYFHIDGEKRQQLEKYDDMKMPSTLILIAFIDSIRKLTTILFEFDDEVIAEILKHQDENRIASFT